MTVPSCPHRGQLDTIRFHDGTETNIAHCNLLTRELGFVNSVSEAQCQACLEGRTTPPRKVIDTRVLLRLAKKHLVARVHCHDDPKFATYADAPLGAAIEKMKVLGMDRREIGDAILVARERGMTIDRALALVEDHDLDHAR